MFVVSDLKGGKGGAAVEGACNQTASCLCKTASQYGDATHANI